MRLQIQKILLIIIISIILLIFNFTWLYKKIRNIEIENNITQLYNCLTPLSSHLIKNRHILSRKEVDKALKEISKILHIRLTFIDPSGKILGDSWKELSVMDIIADTKEFKEAIIKGKGVAIRYDRITNKYMLCVAKSIYVNKTIIGVLVASKPMDEIDPFISKSKKYIFYTAIFWALIFILLMLTFYYITIADIKSIFNSIFDMFKQKEKPSKLERNYIFLQFSNIVDEIKKISQTLHNYKKLNEIFLMTTYSSIVITNSEGQITSFNKSFYNLFGKSKIDLTKLNIKDIFRNFDFNKIFYKSQKIGKALETEIEIYINNKFYPFKIKVRPIDSTNKVLIELYGLDKIKKLESFEKELITNINHELKTPLSIIKGFTETLKDEMLEENIDKEKLNKFVETIYKHTLRLEEALNGILTLAENTQSLSLKDIKKTSTNITTLINELLESFRLIAEKSNIHLKKDFANTSIYWDVNPILIKQAVGNLINNAIKFSPQGSSVIVGLKKDEKSLIIYVKDQGIGIDQKYYDKIFEKFFKIKGSHIREGSGLGLYIAKKIIELHGGEITVKSEPLKGSTFTVILKS